MTAPTLAPPVSSGPPLPAPPPSLNTSFPDSHHGDSFLDVINNAVKAKGDSKDDSSDEKDDGTKTTSTATAPAKTETDANAISMLMALLMQKMPSLPLAALHKPGGSGASGKAIAGISEATQPPPGASKTETKVAKPPSAENEILQALAEGTKDEPAKAFPTSGTAVANNSQRMNSSSERNEIAWRVEQKLPLKPVSAALSSDADSSSAEGGTKLPMSFTWQDVSPENLPITNVTTSGYAATAAVAAATSTSPAVASAPVVEIPAPATAAAAVDRVEQMISREAVSVRQSGAQNVGVSLNLDSNTQLFLQLTTHNGVTQASVRIDRGQFAPEQGQWAQLQQSLSKQNVELLPMTGSSNLNSQQNSDSRSRQFATRQDSFAETADGITSSSPRQQQKQPQTRSRKNWETWA
jgi:hypothetical protein